MPDITIVKFKVRRGSDEERSKVVLEQGELGYTVDTKRLFVGDGILSGGDVAGAKVHDVLTTSDTRGGITNAYKNDLVFENNWMYQLTGTDFSNLDDWKFIGGSVPDYSTLNYNSSREIRVADQGITSDQIQDSAIIGSKFDPTSAVHISGGIVVNSTYGLSANIDDSTLEIDGNVIKVANAGITTTQLASGSVTKTEINSSSIGRGLSGGDGAQLSVKADNTSIIFNGEDEIAIGEINASSINVGPGISNDDGRLTHIIEEVNVSEFDIDSQATLNLAQRLSQSVTHFLPRIEVDDKGIIAGSQNGNVLALSSNAPNFGGFYSQLSGSETNTLVTAVTAATATNTHQLSSAGFMILRMGAPDYSDNTTNVNDYYAVPVYRVPDEILSIFDSSFIVDPYTFEWSAYRAYDPTSNDYELDGQILSAAACSGVYDYTGYAEPVIVFTNVQEPTIGDVFAIAPNTLSAGALSGWIGIDLKGKVYNVDQSSIIQAVSTCGNLYPIALSAYRAYDPTSNDYTANIATLSSAACSGADSSYTPTDLVVVYGRDNVFSVGDYIAGSTTELQPASQPSLSGWIRLESIHSTVYQVDENNQVRAVSACDVT